MIVKKLVSLSFISISLLCVLFSLNACGDSPVNPEPPIPPTPVDTAIFVEGCSGTLPMLFINTDSAAAIVSKEEYLYADWWLDPMGIDGVDSLGSFRHPLRMQIRGRGNSTWTNLDKKSYRLKFDEKHKVLGMHASRHWALLAQALSWMGQMNDALPFEIGRRMGMAWNPHMQPVEVALNGQYIGLYFLTENVRVAKNRVNVIEQNDYETELDKVTGGWLLEIENYVQHDNIIFTEGNGQPFWITVHSPELLSEEQRDYITHFLLETDSAIYVEDKESQLWEQYIDIDSLAIYYIVQEIMDNPVGICLLHPVAGGVQFCQGAVGPVLPLAEIQPAVRGMNRVTLIGKHRRNQLGDETADAGERNFIPVEDEFLYHTGQEVNIHNARISHYRIQR